ncbi:hypothetical protein PVAP13_3NG317700 [Panicum virgatum]|uniref:Uncharacterized protein n=1 Tax=Panicum virgatum TaxID=38727 RepID=A0A8T0UGU6_PANVG|nr:hypothetical protein PVAP13_3NG317700 [Panicum virgatum]
MQAYPSMHPSPMATPLSISPHMETKLWARPTRAARARPVSSRACLVSGAGSPSAINVEDEAQIRQIQCQPNARTSGKAKNKTQGWGWYPANPRKLCNLDSARTSANPRFGALLNANGRLEAATPRA